MKKFGVSQRDIRREDRLLAVSGLVSAGNAFRFRAERVKGIGSPLRSDRRRYMPCKVFALCINKGGTAENISVFRPCF